MRTKTITDIATELLTLTEVKTHLRLTSDTTEDTMLGQMITRARRLAEKYTRRALGTQTVEAYLDNWPAGDRFELPRAPLQSVTSVKYVNNAGIETTMTAATDYLVDSDNEPGSIVLPYGINWPTFIAYPINPIRIRYVAGYTTLPEDIKLALLLIIGGWYENRENTVETVGGRMTEIPMGAETLLSNYRLGWFE